MDHAQASPNGGGVPALTARLRLNASQVVAEIIEGEVVIIHLGTGTYYCLAGAGADVWTGLIEQASVAEILDRITARWDTTAEVAERDLRPLIDDLIAEDLAYLDGHTGEPATVATTARGDRRQPYAAPVLEKFTDMQDLILLDPVHEVGDEGWPHPRPDLRAVGP